MGESQLRKAQEAEFKSGQELQAKLHKVQEAESKQIELLESELRKAQAAELATLMRENAARLRRRGVAINCGMILDKNDRIALSHVVFHKWVAGSAEEKARRAVTLTDQRVADTPRARTFSLGPLKWALSRQ